MINLLLINKIVLVNLYDYFDATQYQKWLSTLTQRWIQGVVRRVWCHYWVKLQIQYIVHQGRWVWSHWILFDHVLEKQRWKNTVTVFTSKPYRKKTQFICKFCISICLNICHRESVTIEFYLISINLNLENSTPVFVHW